MIERLIYLIVLSVSLTMIIMASFILGESVKKKNLVETIFWLAILFTFMFLAINCPIFSWSIYNFM